MVSLIFANIHPSRSLIADLKKYESLTDVNLNEDLPFELAQMMKLEMKHGSNAPLRDLRTSVPSCRAEHSYFSTAYQKTGATRTPYMT